MATEAVVARRYDGAVRGFHRVGRRDAHRPLRRVARHRRTQRLGQVDAAQDDRRSAAAGKRGAASARDRRRAGCVRERSLTSRRSRPSIGHSRPRCGTSSRWGASRGCASGSISARDDREAVQRAIELVGMTPLAPRPIANLSGGQQQRAFVARAIAQEPQLLLLDEPTTGVDAATEEALRNIVLRLSAGASPS